MELLRNRVSEWSYCAIESVGGAIVQYNRVNGWSYCTIGSVGGAIAQ